MAISAERRHSVINCGSRLITLCRPQTGTSPSLGLNAGMVRVAERSGAGRDRVSAFDAGGEGGGEKAVEVAVEDRAGVRGFDAGAQILDHLVGLQDVGA